MRFIKYTSLMMAVFLFSCTVEKTPFGNRLNFASRGSLQEVTYIKENGHNISIEASDGEFLRGYNDLAIKIVTANTLERLNVEEVQLSITHTDKQGRVLSAPYSKLLNNSEDNRIFKGFAVFDTPKDYSVLNATHTGIKTPWNIALTYKIDGVTYQAQKEIEVLDTRNPNLNMTEFQGKDGKKYYIALIAPEIPKVAVNNLVAGIWVEKSDNTYEVANNYVLELDPRMPGEDMGNHSSPDNQDLTQKNDGFYHGKVNYTMQGYWTLNFILKDSFGNIVKGTQVSKKVQMGVFGEQSDLHIDILF
ncbi:hypothetical protein [Capnocytophaga sp. G2]|uniref:hypothetical protein n=1 Tax=Capnocytophaga sp. G2 TaxID=3110695 RepID=UPI002B490398|nr:hypothetical protein [Capnocytophaga sp. G2]MEB3004360.1 hypothetical protein [Capnocytophaga sp. G2]